MKEIYINNQIEQNGVEHGMAILNKTVNENLPIVFPNDTHKIIENLITTHPNKSFYSFDRFCQYIVYTQYQAIIGLFMKISDFDNNVDLALEEYQELRGMGWAKADLDKIMRLFQEIEKDSANLATMVIKDPVPLPPL